MYWLHPTAQSPADRHPVGPADRSCGHDSRADDLGKRRICPSQDPESFNRVIDDETVRIKRVPALDKAVVIEEISMPCATNRHRAVAPAIAVDTKKEPNVGLNADDELRPWGLYQLVMYPDDVEDPQNRHSRMTGPASRR